MIVSWASRATTRMLSNPSRVLIKNLLKLTCKPNQANYIRSADILHSACSSALRASGGSPHSCLFFRALQPVPSIGAMAPATSCISTRNGLHNVRTGEPTWLEFRVLKTIAPTSSCPMSWAKRLLAHTSGEPTGLGGRERFGW